MYELLSLSKVVFYSLLMILILVVMSLSLLSILSEDMDFTEETITFRKGRGVRIFWKLLLCGFVLAGYFLMMVWIR